MNGRHYQEYYVAYAAAHGRGPVEQMEADRERWPGGPMAGFLAWMGERWREFHAAIGCDCGNQGARHRDEFVAWLRARASEVTP